MLQNVILKKSVLFIILVNKEKKTGKDDSKSKAFCVS